MEFMTTNDHFDFLIIKTHVLKVHINCQGCEKKVRKLLRKIEGVYNVNIDAEEQKITVVGIVDSATLIKRLVRAGKHAELWSPSSNQFQEAKRPKTNRDPTNNNQRKEGPNMGDHHHGLSAFENQTLLPTFFGSEADYNQYDDNIGFVGLQEHEFLGLQDLSSALPAVNQLHLPAVNHQLHQPQMINCPPSQLIPTNTETYYNLEESASPSVFYY